MTIFEEKVLNIVDLKKSQNDMSEPMYKIETETKFFIIAGSLGDLSKFDFAPYNTQCLKITSKKLGKICKEMSYELGDSISPLLKEISNKFGKYDQPFVLLPLDFGKEFNIENLFSCYEIILVLFPSDLAIFGEITFQLFDYRILHRRSYQEFRFRSTGKDSYCSNYVFYHKNELGQINHFIKLYKERKSNIKYIETTINAYISSFQERRPEMALLSLCISLESIVEGTTELSFRIKRNVAILCAEEKFYAERIFDNLDLIYKLRSKIVHADKYKPEKVCEYLPYLQGLVSRLILELVLQNIQTISELNRSLTFAGFGDRKILNEGNGYAPMTLNVHNYANTIFNKLTK